MKLAHYLHIAPRTLFVAQGLATLVGAIVQCGVTVFMITRIPGVCNADAPDNDNFTCPHGRVTYSSSLIWGALGPQRTFSPGQIYSNLLWFFLVGPVVVVATYMLGRRWRWFNYVSWPVAFGAMSLVPPATGINFSSWWVVNAIFNGFVKRLKPAWWSKYSESAVLSALLSCAPLTNRLSPLCGAGLGRGRLDGHHLLLHRPAGGLAELVGEYRLPDDGGRQGYAIQESPWRRVFRATEGVVVTGCIKSAEVVSRPQLRHPCNNTFYDNIPIIDRESHRVRGIGVSIGVLVGASLGPFR